MSLTFTAVANRLYKATFSGTINRNSNTNVNLYLTDGSNTVIAEYTDRNVADVNTSTTFCFLFTASAGSITRKIRGAASSGAAGILFAGTNFQYSFMIEDMGPS
jgi:hypothetical protein